MAVAKACVFISKDLALFQHSFQHCVSAQRCVSAYVSTLCFNNCSNLVFQHMYHYCVSDVATLCFSISSSICVPASVFQHLCSIICVSASVFQHLCSIICVLASMFQHLLCVLHNQPISINDNLNHLRQLLCSSSISALCFCICDPFVFQHLCSSICVPTSVF